MCPELRPQSLRGVRSGLPWSLAILLVLCAGTASADVTVNCPSDSINAILASLDKTVPNRVNIYGTCVESVLVEGFKNLTLAGQDGAVIQ